MLEILDIELNSIEKVKKFVDVTNKFDSDMYISQGRYVIDAKSIMGIFSLDLTKTLCLQYEFNDNDDSDAFLIAMKEFR